MAGPQKEPAEANWLFQKTINSVLQFGGSRGAAVKFPAAAIADYYQLKWLKATELTLRALEVRGLSELAGLCFLQRFQKSTHACPSLCPLLVARSSPAISKAGVASFPSGFLRASQTI